jgi:hypothetical protein
MCLLSFIFSFVLFKIIFTFVRVLYVFDLLLLISVMHVSFLELHYQRRAVLRYICKYYREWTAPHFWTLKDWYCTSYSRCFNGLENVCVCVCVRVRVVLCCLWCCCWRCDGGYRGQRCEVGLLCLDILFPSVLQFRYMYSVLIMHV